MDYSLLVFGYTEEEDTASQIHDEIYRYDFQNDRFILNDIILREPMWAFTPLIVPGYAIYNDWQKIMQE